MICNARVIANIQMVAATPLAAKPILWMRRCTLFGSACTLDAMSFSVALGSG